MKKPKTLEERVFEWLARKEEDEFDLTKDWKSDLPNWTNIYKELDELETLSPEIAEAYSQRQQVVVLH